MPGQRADQRQPDPGVPRRALHDGCRPAAARPLRSAARTMLSAVRSLMEPPGFSDSSLTKTVLPSPRLSTFQGHQRRVAHLRQDSPGVGESPPLAPHAWPPVPARHGAHASPRRIVVVGRGPAVRSSGSAGQQFPQRLPGPGQPVPPPAGALPAARIAARRRRRSPFRAASPRGLASCSFRARASASRYAAVSASMASSFSAASTERSSCWRASGASVEWSSTSADSVGAPSVAGAARNFSSASSPAAEYQSSPGRSSDASGVPLRAASRLQLPDEPLRRIELGDPPFAADPHVGQPQPQRLEGQGQLHGLEVPAGDHPARVPGPSAGCRRGR